MACIPAERDKRRICKLCLKSGRRREFARRADYTAHMGEVHGRCMDCGRLVDWQKRGERGEHRAFVPPLPEN